MSDADATNLSTEHQPPGDAKRPLDTLDRDRVKAGGQSPEPVEARPSVGSVDPEDYPKDAPDH